MSNAKKYNVNLLLIGYVVVRLRKTSDAGLKTVFSFLLPNLNL